MADEKIINNQITRAKILSENLYDMLEKYSFMDLTDTFVDANRTMDVLVCCRQIYDILEDLYDNQVVEKIDNESNEFAGTHLNALINPDFDGLSGLLKRRK